MAFGNEKCIATSRMEPRPQHRTPDVQTSGKTKKRDWKTKPIEFLKPEETEEMKGNEIKNNDTWIKVVKNRDRWKAMESECAKTAAAASVDSVHSRRHPAQDPIRPARNLNGVKLDDEVVNIA